MDKSGGAAHRLPQVSPPAVNQQLALCRLQVFRILEVSVRQLREGLARFVFLMTHVDLEARLLRHRGVEAVLELDPIWLM